MEKLVMTAFLLLILQGVLGYKQIKNYQSRTLALSRKGITGIGREKGVLKAGNLTILVSDKNGKIITAEKMEGITVFSRFNEMKNLKGMSIGELKEEYLKGKNKIGKKAMIQAIEELERKIKEKSSVDIG